MMIDNDTITINVIRQIKIDIAVFKDVYLNKGLQACIKRFKCSGNQVVAIAKELGISLGPGRKKSKK